jgi:hypothetical protein
MHCKPFSAENLEDWDDFVLNNPFSWIGHLSIISRLEQVLAGAGTKSILVYNDKNRVIAVLPLYEAGGRELRYIPIKTLSTGSLFPSGPLLDQKLSLKESKEVLDCMIAQMMAIGKASDSDRINISYPAVYGDKFGIDEYGFYPLRRYGFSDQNIVGMALDLRKEVAELMSGVKGNCRNMIRRAEKDGAEFEVIIERSRWLECHALNRQTLGDHAYSEKTMEMLWDEVIVPGYGTVTAATFNSQIMSVVVTVGINKSAYYWMGFNAKPVILTGANNYALWQTMLHWKNRGSTFFEMGSLEFIGDKMMKISAFKESFGGKPHYLLSGFIDLKKVKRKTIEVIDAMITSVRNNSDTVR